MLAYDPRGERATRDIVSRVIIDRIRLGHASPNGGVFIQMGHLGPERVRKRVQGHGGALRRLRLRPRRRQGRGHSDRALHDGRRRVCARLHHRDAAALCGRRGYRRRARRQPARRQRRRQLDRLRRHRRRCHGGADDDQAPSPSSTAMRSKPHARARLLRSDGAAAISKRSAARCTMSCGTMSASCAPRPASSVGAPRSIRLRPTSPPPASRMPSRATTSPGPIGSIWKTSSW